MHDTDTPYLIVDELITMKNIERMARRARDLGKVLRPHSKTHKSPMWADVQIQQGADGVMVAKLAEAEVMASHQIATLSLGYPVIGSKRINRLHALAKNGVQLRVSVDSLEGLQALSRVGQELDAPIEALVEVDTGMHRVGLLHDSDIVEMVRVIQNTPGVLYAGITCFGGHVAKSLERNQIILRIREENQRLGDIRDVLTQNRLAPRIISQGGTIAAAFMDELTVATELRPGTYIYNDAQTIAAYGATMEHVALTVKTMVVSKPTTDRAILDAGSKTLSSDGPLFGSYGIIKGHPDSIISNLSEEHGIVESRHHGAVSLKIGDVVEVIPNHVCTTVNLHERVVGRRGEQIRMIPTLARGCVS